MLIDINAYVGHWPFKKLVNNTCNLMLRNMDRFGIDRAVISNINGIFYKNTQSANDELFFEWKSDKRYIDRFILFAVINPVYAGWRTDFETCYKSYGMRGVRLYPKYHDYSLETPSLIELIKRARDYGLPVALCLRMVDSRQRSWLDISEEWALKDVVPIIEEVPDAKYLILNVANSMELDFEETELFKRTNLLIDTSGRSIDGLGTLLDIYGKDKFAFGSHAPILDPLTGLLRIESLNIEGSTRDMLVYRNAETILGL